MFNLIGLGAPLLLAVMIIPVLVRDLGPDRFGLLALIWAVTSYFGLFDLGLGRALTQQLAALDSNSANSTPSRVASLCWTAVLLMLGLGALGGGLMTVAAPSGLSLLDGVPDQVEGLQAVWWMAAGLPFIVGTAGLRGILEARHAFGAVNLIRLPMGAWTFVGPWLSLQLWGPGLAQVAMMLVVGRLLAFLAHAWVVMRLVPELRAAPRVDRMWLRPLCVSGGWMTVSNVVSPFMGYVDRFIIAAMVSAAAVTYYVTPLELAIKLSIFPAAITAVLFPSIAALAVRPGAAVWPLCEEALAWLLLAMAVTALPIAVFAPELLSLWISAEMAQRSAGLLQLFCMGMTVNCLAHIPFTLLQGASAARSTALIHCVELPLFLLLLWVLVSVAGVQGAALAWLVRICADAGALFFVSARRLGMRVGQLATSPLRKSLLILGGGFAACWIEDAFLRSVAVLACCALVGAVLLPASLRAARQSARGPISS